MGEAGQTFYCRAGNIASHDRRGVNSERVIPQRGQRKQNISVMNLKLWSFSSMLLGLQHRKCEAVRFCAAEKSLLSLLL